MSITPFKALQQLRPVQGAVSDVTLKDFSGGLLATKSDVALSNKFATVSYNFVRNNDGSMSVRPGHKQLLDFGSAVIVGFAHFNGSVIVFFSNGTISRYTGAGSAVQIWSNAIAALLPDEPAGWGTGVTRTSFTVFKSELLVQNGRDKPIKILPDFSVDYLQDVVTGTNIHTPIGNYITTVGNFCVVADVVGEKELFISSAGVAGVWPGDTAPNNSTTFNLGSWVSSNTSVFRGLASWQEHCFVFFDESIVVLRLGDFSESGVHEPKVVRAFPNIGALSDKAILVTEKALLFVSQQGLHKVGIESFTKEFVLEKIAEDFSEPLLQAIVNKPAGCTSCQLVQLSEQNQLILQLRQISGPTVVFNINHNKNFSKFSWGRFTNWDWKLLSLSANNRLLLADDRYVYVQGNTLFPNENYTDDDGDAIAFDYETGWLDANARMKVKKLLRTLIDAMGTAHFTIQLFVDRFYKNAETNEYTPAVEMRFRGGEAIGYGTDEGSYSARRTSDDGLYALPAKFRLLKIRVVGETTQPLTISAISLVFREGKYAR